MTGMTDQMFALEIPGFGWADWGTSLDELAARLPLQNTTTRQRNPERPEFAKGQCAKRDAIITTEGTACGMEAVARMNFRDGRLCAVHYHFAYAAPGESEEFCAVVDCLRRRLTTAMGQPELSVYPRSGITLDYKWQADGLHVEIRACVDDEHDLELLANDPKSCAWCQ